MADGICCCWTATPGHRVRMKLLTVMSFSQCPLPEADRVATFFVTRLRKEEKLVIALTDADLLIAQISNNLSDFERIGRRLGQRGNGYSRVCIALQFCKTGKSLAKSNGCRGFENVQLHFLYVSGDHFFWNVILNFSSRSTCRWGFLWKSRGDFCSWTVCSWPHLPLTLKRNWTRQTFNSCDGENHHLDHGTVLSGLITDHFPIARLASIGQRFPVTWLSRNESWKALKLKGFSIANKIQRRTDKSWAKS